VLGASEILGFTSMGFLPIAQTGIFFFNLGFLFLHVFILAALCFRFIRSREEYHSLLQRSLEAQDRERARIGRDLHDQCGQSLQAVLLQLQRKQNIPESLEAAKEHVLVAIDEIRIIAHNLHPPLLNVLPLDSAIDSFLDEYMGLVPFKINRHLECCGKLNDHLEVQIFRTFQEAFGNIVRHAQATVVSVCLRKTEKKLVLEISDDGVAVMEKMNQKGSV